ncbi:MAG: GHKL domain-containing protein [Lachnospiraceae bacterium]|nr:GHKL domain-containing protein [Lachnospiraceae bacterium]
MSGIYFSNSIAVAAFGMILSAAFCDVLWTWRKRLIMAVSIAIILLFQGFIFFRVGVDIVEYTYPMVTHFPLIIVLCVLSKKRLWPTISVLTAYLCCQTRRWLALLIVAIFSGGTAMQSIAELVMTLPLLLILLRFVAPSVRSVSRHTFTAQWQFGLVPALYYGFDYLTSVYTNLLLDGVLVAVEFMPFVCSVAYLVFIVYYSEAGRIRSQLEQMQAVLNLQVTQAVREIEALRESRQKTRIYRHDLRHHMQYISSCIESGRLEQAQEYIREICSEIEMNEVIVYCENEAANLIFSAFTGRAKECDIPITIRAGIAQSISIPESDLCVLLSNALENALRACRRRKERGLSATIEVDAYQRNGKFFLQVINSCEEDITFEHGLPVTNKPGHGIGVRSISAVVERYNGIYSFSVKDDKFILRVSL